MSSSSPPSSSAAAAAAGGSSSSSSSAAAAAAGAAAPGAQLRSKFRFLVEDVRAASREDPVFVELHPDAMASLDVFEHDFVELRGKMRRSTVCIVRENAEVPPTALATSDPVRKNLRLKLGDMLSVHPVDAVDARRVQLSPIEDTVEGVTGDLARVFLVPHFTQFTRPVKRGDLLRVTRAMKDVWFKVTEVDSPSKDAWGRVNLTDMSKPLTELLLGDPISREDGEAELNVAGYSEIGGLSEQLQQIREMVELPVRHPKLFSTIGVKPPKGVLMHGPPGCGKTMIARAISHEAGAQFFLINGPEIMSAKSGGSEQNLRSIFEEAEKNSPAIIFIDELDAIAPNREKVQDEQMRRIVATLLTLMDGIKSNAHIMVIGATNRPNSIDPALRRSGRFDAEIVIPVPSRKGRLEILQIATRKQRKAPDVDLEKIADKTHGFVGADLSALAMKAAISCIRRSAQGVVDMESEDLDAGFLDSLMVTMADYDECLKTMSTSLTRDVVVETPNVSFDDIGGLEDVKRELREMVDMPVRHGALFEDMGILPPKGALMYGPPGCGKTLLAKAMAKECSANFICVKGPQLLTKWFGESEENVRDIFNKARMAAPCVLFFDELDSIAQARGHGESDAGGAGDRVVNQLLTEMDGISQRNNLFIIGATNRPDTMDSAILRPGRLDQLIYIPLPDREARLGILRATLRKTRVAPDVSLEQLADDTDRFSGADLAGLCQMAVKISVRKRIEAAARGEETADWSIGHEVIEIAKQNTRRSISDEQLEMYSQHARNLVQTLGMSSTLTTRDLDATRVTGRYRRAVAVAVDAAAPAAAAPAAPAAGAGAAGALPVAPAGAVAAAPIPDEDIYA